MSSVPEYEKVVAGTLNRVLPKDESGQHNYTHVYNDLVHKYKVVYHVQDDFTVALLIQKYDSVTVAVGVSKRNTIDKKLPIRGKSLALNRAIRAYLKLLPVTKNDNVVHDKVYTNIKSNHLHV